MSYTDDYYKALRKRQEKQKKENALSVQSSNNKANYVNDSYSQEYYNASTMRNAAGLLGEADIYRAGFWNDRVNSSITTLNGYRNTINSGGYLSSADLSSYEKALSYYKLGSNKLRSIFSRIGYATEDDETWATRLSAMDDSVRSLSNYFSQWKDEEEYNKDKSYSKSGKDFSKLDEKDLKKRIANLEEKVTSAIDKDSEVNARKELGILKGQLSLKQKVNNDLKLLNKEQKEAYLYYLGKDLEDGTSYADEYIASVTRKDDSGMQFFKKNSLFDDGYQFGDVSKTILGTASDALVDAGKGLFRMGEGIADWMAYGVANIADWTGNDAYANTLRKSATGSFTDNVFGGVDDYLDKSSVLGRTSDAIFEGVGQAGAIYATGGVLGALGLGAGGTSAATTGLMYLSGTGSGIGEAYQAGATDKEAQIYGRISGAADAISELIFGGMGKGFNALGFSKGLSNADDMLAKKISNIFTSRLGKNLAEYGIKAGAEGLEEVIAGGMQAIGKWVTYSKEDLGDILADENLLEQFVVGAFTSGIMQRGDFKKAKKAGRDFITKLTDNEQLVVDTEYFNRLQEATKDGKKLTKKQENELYEEVISDMDKGLISTDTIESVLGGEDYKGYSSLVEKETSLTERKNALTKEIEALLDKPNPTIRDNERLAAARQELATVEQSLKGLDVDTARNNLHKTISNLVQNDTRLHESFNERARRFEDLQLDVEKYTGAAKTTAENLLKGGLNNTYKVRTLADMLTRISADKNVVFNALTAQKIAEAGLGVEGRTVNGVKTKDGIILNIESGKKLESVAGHEITHTMEEAGHYDELAQAIKEYAELKGDYQNRYSQLERIYSKKDANGNILKDENGNTVFIRDDVNIDAEVVADLVGDYLFTDEDFINNLSTKHRNVFQKIFDEIKYLLKIATAGSEEARKLEEVKKKFEQAYRDSAEVTEMSDTDVQYSIREEAPPKETGVAYKVFFVKDGKLYPPMVANPDGQDTPIGVWLNADVGTSAPPSKTGRPQVKAGGNGTQGGSGSLAFRPGWHLGDLPRASQFDRVNPETGKKELFPENFVWAEVEYAKDVDYQEEAMSYGYTENGKFRHAYAGLPRLPENGYYRYRTNPKPDTVPWVITGAMKVNRLLSDAEVNEILEKNGVAPVHRQGGDVGLDKFGFDENGAVKYSLSADSEGKTLYTGSPVTNIQQFKVGGVDGTKQNGDRYGRGIYLTTNQSTAKGYAGDSGRVYAINADDLNIYDLNDPITEEMKATLRRELNGKDKQFRNSVLRNFRTEKTFTDFESAEQFFDEQRKVWKEEDGYYSANKPEIKSADDKTGMAVIEYTDFINIDNAIGSLTGNHLYDALKSISTDDFASFITGHGFDGIAFDEDANNQQYVIYRNEDRLHILEDGDAAPASKQDIRFSLSEAVEETKNLVALHNLTENKLLKVMDLGGFPMPSIAVTKADIPHTNFGDITLVMDRSTIDPKANKKNTVYSADAWTPTVPPVEYKPNDSRLREISNKVYGLIGDRNIVNALDYIAFDADNVSHTLDRYDGDLASAYTNNDTMKYAFLKDIGADIELPMKEAKLHRSVSNDAIRYFSGKLVSVGYYDNMSSTDIMNDKGLAEAVADALNWDVMRKFEEGTENYEKLKANPLYKADDLSFSQIDGILSGLRKYSNQGISQEVDGREASNTIRNYISNNNLQEQYEAWLGELFNGVVEKTGIYNNKDIFTPSGNRRTFEQLHLPVTLENIVKAMASQNGGNTKNVAGFNGVKTLRAGMAERFKSIEDMHRLEGRLQHLTEEEFEAVHDQLSGRMNDVITRILATAPESSGNIYMRMDSVGETLMEIAESGKYSTEAIKKVVNQYIYNIDESLAEDIRTLLYDVSQMPTNMFEAKPERAVGFDEVRAVLLPDNASSSVRERLAGMGVNVLTYEAGNDTDRLSKLNGLLDEQPDLKFSLSMPGEISPPYGKHGVYGWEAVKQDPYHPLGPTRNDVAPANVQADVAEDLPIAPEVQTDNVDVESLVGDKDNFVSKKAMELYQEITGLKKGVRASRQLGYLLDHGYEWRSIKTALLNIRDNPNQVVNPNSQAESVAREMLGREYDNMVAELTEPTDVASKIRINMQHIQTELDNNRKLREQSNADYDAEIADTQAKYDAKKNKNTIEANNLLRRIERLNRLKNTNDANYAKRINDLEQRLEKMSSPTYKTAMQRRAKHDEYMALAKELVGDTSTWKDKKLGLSYKVNTFRRNLRDIVRDANGNRDITKADAITDEYQGNYNRNEADLKREDRRLKSPIAKLNLTRAEYVYSHMLGEFRHNPDTKLTEDAVKEYYNKHKKNIDTEKVDKAIEETRKIFDELFDRVNARLREQGMKEIPYRKGYFPHFTKPHQGFLAKLFNWKTVDNEIPTSVAGITETFNPEKSWQSFNKERKADTTDYDLAQALDTYIHGALDWIYHIEDIQKRRALENFIRYIHSDEGVKAEIEKIRNNEEYDADEAQDRIDLVYAQARNPLNNFVTDLRAGTNTLAAKKSSMDRAIEEKTNRKIYSVMTNLNNRVSANMVVGSFSSALTNFIPITQSWSAVSPWYSLRGMKDTIANTIRDDGVVNKSTFLTNRLRNEENLYRTTWDKVSDKAAFLMEAIDSFTSQTVWRSKYLQNISEGMSEAEAIADADQFAENVIAGRSRGNMPTIFDAKNPITKIFTAFQLEVANQYGYFFKDAPQDAKNKARLTKGYATAFLGAYAYNALYSTLVGRTAAFDPLRILEELFKDMGFFGEDDEEEPEDIILNLTENVLQEVPFVGGLLGGGRIPLSSALPYSGEYGGFDALVKDISEGNNESITKEWMKPLFYLVMPMGGGQLKKSIEGLGMFSDEHPISGSYTDSGNLRFPVEKTPWNVLQAGLFGQYANANARDYFDNGRQPLKEKQIQEFIDVDIPIADYWEYREGLAEQDTLEEKFDYIAGLDLPVAKKNILINNIVDREESVDMTDYDDYSSLDEFDFATKKPGKYAIAEAVGGYNSYTKYTDALGDIHADKDSSGKSINGSRKEKVQAYIESLPLEYGEKIILHKMEYPADDTYNYDIVEYLDSRDDISYEQMVSILEELGFKVNGQQISWD